MPRIPAERASFIKDINQLIIQYRQRLTTNHLNLNGGFNVKDDIVGSPTCGFIPLAYQPPGRGVINLEVMHYKGQVYGFKLNPPNPFIYCGNLHDDLTKPKGPADKIAAEFFLSDRIRALSSDRAGREALKGILRKCVGTLPPLLKAIDTVGGIQQGGRRGHQVQKPLSDGDIKAIIDCLATLDSRSGDWKEFVARTLGVGSALGHIVRTYPELGAESTELSTTAIQKAISILFPPNPTACATLATDPNIVNEVLSTFLLICSEGAKNSFAQQRLIATLVRHETEAVNLPDRVHLHEMEELRLASALVHMGQKCQNGRIDYFDGGNPVELEQIITETFRNRGTFAAIFGINPPLPRLDEELYRQVLVSARYAQYTAVLSGDPGHVAEFEVQPGSELEYLLAWRNERDPVLDVRHQGPRHGRGGGGHGGGGGGRGGGIGGGDDPRARDPGGGEGRAAPPRGAGIANLPRGGGGGGPADAAEPRGHEDPMITDSSTGEFTVAVSNLPSPEKLAGSGTLVHEAAVSDSGGVYAQAEKLSQSLTEKEREQIAERLEPVLRNASTLRLR